MFLCTKDHTDVSTEQILPAFCFPSYTAPTTLITSATQAKEQHLEMTKRLEAGEIDEAVKRARADLLQGFEETFTKQKDIGMLIKPDQLSQIIAPQDLLNQIRVSQDKTIRINVPQDQLSLITVPQRNADTTAPTSHHCSTNLGNPQSKDDINPQCKEIWQLADTMCTAKKDGQLSSACGIVTTSNRDFVVADMGSATVKVYDQLGRCKLSIKTNQVLQQKSKQLCHIREVAVSSDGRFFVTDKTRSVKVFDANGILMQTFSTVPPSPQHALPATTSNAQLSGLTVDNGYLYVGEVKTKYISKHRLDGSHVQSIKLTIAPWYLAITSQSNLVISSPIDQTVQVTDCTGRLLCSLKGPGDWMPTGVCCSIDTVYVCNFASGCNGVYRFSVFGQYLGCVTKDVADPTGVALTKDGDRLLVAQWGRRGVNIFNRRIATSSTQ